MKITRRQLRRLIKEEMSRTLNEQEESEPGREAVPPISGEPPTREELSTFMNRVGKEIYSMAERVMNSTRYDTGDSDWRIVYGDDQVNYPDRLRDLEKKMRDGSIITSNGLKMSLLGRLASSYNGILK